MAEWIKMPIGTEVGLGPGDIVLDGDPPSPERCTTAPTFLPMSIVAKRLDQLTVDPTIDPTVKITG